MPEVKFEYGTAKQYSAVKWIESILDIEYIGDTYEEMSEFINDYIDSARYENHIQDLHEEDYRDVYGDNF